MCVSAGAFGGWSRFELVNGLCSDWYTVDVCEPGLFVY